MRLALALLFLAATATAANAAPDVAQGKKLVAEKNCEACHQIKARGDAIYLRKDRKVTSIAKLKAQVEMCNSELNLQMFPDEEEHVTAFLNETYYKFTPAKP